ncbi:MAG: hypothetical protein O2958_10970 [Gemmatimonadetes bacterium]|nr:hypothetical protein [Gemmatimonadota bacterium]MDA1103714.1 hypothetical protein [Gemmatimonadota bacterium]
MTPRKVGPAAALFLLLVGVGCDSGPSGPGALTGRVTGQPLGAVVLEVTGVGIQGFDGRGSSQAYSAAVAGRVDTYRVVLVDAVGGDITFDIRVDDVRMEPPTVVVIAAARPDNVSQPVATLAVIVER